MAIIHIRSKNNKEVKFTELLEENKLRFYKTAKIILKNDDDVYDALQEALISMYQHYDRLKSKEKFSAWGTRIVINKSYDFLRSKRKNIIPFDEKIENDMKLAQYDEYDSDKYGIKKAMEYLSEDQKLVTMLYYYDDYSVKEIAEIINVPEGTVKSRLSKVREILKEKLEKGEF